MISMPFLVTSNLAAVILLVILAISGFITVFRGIGISYKKSNRFAIFELSQDKVKSLGDVLNELGTPFTLEVAINQLGKTRTLYLILPRSKSKQIVDVFGAKEIDDYDLYYPGGVVIGAYALGEGLLKDFDSENLDFSKINEIGESAVIQFVIKKKSKKGFVVNVRALVSAPSSYQAKEIFTSIKASLGGLKLTEIKSREFIDRVNNRTFNEKELVTLS